VYRASVRRELFTRLVWSGRVWPCGLARACSRSSRGVERRGMQTSTPPSRCGPQYSPHAACCECNGKVAESQPGRGRTDSQVLLRHWLRSSRITTFIILLAPAPLAAAEPDAAKQSLLCCGYHCSCWSIDRSDWIAWGRFGFSSNINPSSLVLYPRKRKREREDIKKIGSFTFCRVDWRGVRPRLGARGAWRRERPAFRLLRSSRLMRARTAKAPEKET
jgi:hypothetical protein